MVVMNTMSADTATGLPGRLVALRDELIEQAFELEQRGSVEAADLAMVLSARLDELCAGDGGENPPDAVRAPAARASAGRADSVVP